MSNDSASEFCKYCEDVHSSSRCQILLQAASVTVKPSQYGNSSYGQLPKTGGFYSVPYYYDLTYVPYFSVNVVQNSSIGMNSFAMFEPETPGLEFNARCVSNASQDLHSSTTTQTGLFNLPFSIDTNYSVNLSDSATHHLESNTNQFRRQSPEIQSPKPVRIRAQPLESQLLSKHCKGCGDRYEECGSELCIVDRWERLLETRM
jgi:hypothetical protein